MAGPALLLSAVLLAGSFVSFILALGLAPVANVLIMFGATPFITAIAARIFLGEPLHGHTILAMAVGRRRPRDQRRGLPAARRTGRHGGRASSSSSA